MADRSYRWLWVAVAGCLIVSLAGCAGTATGVNAAGPQPPKPQPAAVDAAEPAPSLPTTPDGPVRVLQLNLCNSGIAGCYTGGESINEAAEVLRTETPDLVTLNEICEEDVSALERALARAVPGGVTSAFQAARDRNTGEAYRCSNGQEFGNGVVSRWPLAPGSSAGGGIYPMQDPDDPEERSWVCLDAAATFAVTVCTTHLVYTDRQVTVDQCRYLFDTVIAERRAQNGDAPLVLGADLNVGSGDGCLPDDSPLVDDGEVQHVVATPEFVVDSSRTIDLRNTDHPGLLVRLDPK
jgi:endonuclease/exonuclease/phosphatase family metal-dependent hydrolase